MSVNREKIIDKINKLEALAQSTTSTAEANAALEKAQNLRSRYKDIIEVKVDASKQNNIPEQWFYEKFCINNINEKKYKKLIDSIYKTNEIPQENRSEIRWVAEIFTQKIFLFFCRKYIDLHIEFSSTSPYTLRNIIRNFLRIANLKIK